MQRSAERIVPQPIGKCKDFPALGERQGTGCREIWTCTKRLVYNIFGSVRCERRLPMKKNMTVCFSVKNRLAMWLTFLSVGVVLCSFLSAPAFGGNVRKIEIVDYGIYQTKVNPDTKATGIKIAETVKLLKKTDVIPGKVGTSFGFRFVVQGEPKGEEVVVMHKFFPPEKSRLLVEEIQQRGLMGNRLYRAYRFDAADEIVPGTWRFEVWHEGKKMAEKSFTVTKAK